MLQTVVTRSVYQLYGYIFENFSKVVVFSIFLSVVKVLDPGRADKRMLVEDPFSLAVVCEPVCDCYEVVKGCPFLKVYNLVEVITIVQIQDPDKLLHHRYILLYLYVVQTPSVNGSLRISWIN